MNLWAKTKTLLRLQRAARERPRPEEMETRAVSGLRAYAGFIQEDYNPDVRGVKWFKIVDQMRNFTRIKAAEALFTLPLLSAHPHFAPPEDAGSAAREAAELIQEDLFETTATAFVDVLRLGLLARMYGVRLIAPAWEIQGERVLVRDFRDLLPHTYYKWKFEHNRPVTVTQWGVDPDSGGMRTIEIPLDRLLRFTWQEEGNNPEGRADARAAYGDWHTINFLDSIVRVAAERAGIGVWTAEIPRDLWDFKDFRDEMQSVIKALRSHQEGGVSHPEGVKISVLSALEKQGIDVLWEMRDRYVAEMSQALLSGIFNVGMRDTGTSAWATELMRLTVMSLNASARWFCQNFCLQFVRKWCAFNYPGMPPKEQPNLVIGDAGLLLQPQALVEAVNQTTEAGNLPSGEPAIQAHVAQILGLPWQPQRQTTRPLTTDYRPAAAGAAIRLQADRSRARDLPQRRQVQMDEFAQAMTEFLERVQQKALQRIEEIAEEYQKAKDLNKGVALAKLQDLELDGQGQYGDLVRQWLWDFYRKARQEAKKRYPQAASDTVSNTRRTAIDTRAQTLARGHFEVLRQALLLTTQDQLESGAAPRVVLASARNEFNRAASSQLYDALVAAGQELVETLNREFGGVTLAAS